MFKYIFLVCIIIAYLSPNAFAQKGNNNDSIQYLTLDQCLAYALQHQPFVLQSAIDVSIAHKTNAIALSAWLPQVNLVGSLEHYFELPTAFQTNVANPSGPLLPVKAGIVNTATPGLTATETIFSPSVLYAAKSAHLYVLQAEQALDSSKINIIANVSTTFYNLLLNLEQIKVLKEDTARLAKNLSDTYHQYIGGTVDKTDYEEATITLNTSKAQLRQAVENIRPLYATVKQAIGFPPEQEFNVLFDTTQMMKELTFDTTQQLQFEKRIELQLLETTKSLQHENVNYYRYAFLPTLSANFNYVHEFESNSFSNLFDHSYPYSYIGASLQLPIFTGFWRTNSLQRAKLQEQLIDLSITNAKSNIYTQYTTALANYKGNLYNLEELKINVTMAKDVYSVVNLQYRQGIVPYLNLITAESNLVSAETSYINATFQLLISKVNLEQAMGIISTKR
jgi:outer membrane protein TolC